MYQLTTHASFDSAHFLSGYEGKCSNIHGHRWKLEITVQSETLEQTGQIRGMVVDFGQLKDDIKKLADEFDHSLIIEDGTLKEKTVEAYNSAISNDESVVPSLIIMISIFLYVCKRIDSRHFDKYFSTLYTGINILTLYMNGLLECHNTISLSKENIKFIYKNQQKSKKKGPGS